MKIIKDYIDKILKMIMNNRILNNLCVVLSADIIVSVIGIINMSMVLNTIGLYGNGIIAIIQTYSLLFNDIFNFQSFNALIKYLPIYRVNKSIQDIKELIKQSFLLDIITAIIATIFAYIFIYPVSKVMGWDSLIKTYLTVYIFTILFNISGTAIGILRHYNKFKYNSNVNLMISIIKLIFYGWGFLFKRNFIYFILIEASLEVLKNILIVIASLIVLRQENLIDFYKAKIKFEKDFFIFNFYSNIVSTLDIPVKHLTTFIIDKFLGVELIAIYKIFQKLGSIIEKIGVPLSQIIYPEISQMIAEKNYSKAFELNRKLIKISIFFGISIIVGVLLTYKIWFGVFISDFESYIFLFIFYLIYIIISYSGIGLHSIFMALGLIKYNVPILVIINPIYLIVLIYLTKNFGLFGMILSLILQTVAILITKYIVVKRNKINICI